MEPKLIGLLGVHGTVVAFRRDTGARLWATHLKSSGFVSLVADHQRVYAHTAGELFCLNLQTGNAVWGDALPGMGYGIGSLALPEVPPSPETAAEQRREEEAAAAAATSSSSS